MTIYKNYDQEALNKQYNNRSRVPEFDQIVQQWNTQSEALRQQIRYHRDLQYGTHERNRLDIFPSTDPHSPVHVYFHGGYWQSRDKADFHFIANGFIKHNITTALVSYPLAPQASMDDIIDSCRQAMAWLYRHVAEYTGDPGRIYISGHSAGGHLVAMLMATNWQELAEDLPANLIKGGCAISGLYNLLPIQLSHVNDLIGMDEATARRNSPIYLSPGSNAPLIVTMGEAESDEYHAQSQELVDAWSKKGLSITHLPIAKANHFSILDHLTTEGASLNRAILAQMGLSSQ